MNRKQLRLFSVAAAAGIFSIACGGGQEPVAQTESPPTYAGPKPLQSVQKTTEAELAWKAPSDWVAEEPSSSMRKAQYKVPGSGGDGMCAVFYFGPGQGGGAMANAERWAGQFSQPDGRASTEAMETTQFEVNGRKVLQVEVTGSYSGGGPTMGGTAEPLPDYMLLGAIVEGPDASWFFKFTGPQQTVLEQKEAFGEMLQSLSAGAD